MTTIMRAFGAYDIPKLLNTPFCHLLQLYDMAERAIKLAQFDSVIAGCAPSSAGLMHDLQRTAKNATIPDKEIMEQLMSKANREVAEKAWREIATKEQ